MLSFLIYNLIFILIQGCYCKLDKQECCIQGRELANKIWQNQRTNLAYLSNLCTLKSLRLHFNTLNQSSIVISTKCLIVARSCCWKSMKRKICLDGASQRENCDSPVAGLSQMLNQIKMECCMCCEDAHMAMMNELESCSLLEEKCPSKHKSDVPPRDPLVNASVREVTDQGAPTKFFQSETQTPIFNITDIQHKTVSLIELENKTNSPNYIQNGTKGETETPKYAGNMTDYLNIVTKPRTELVSDEPPWNESHSYPTTAIPDIKNDKISSNSGTEIIHSTTASIDNINKTDTIFSNTHSSNPDFITAAPAEHSEKSIATTPGSPKATERGTTISNFICEGGKKWDPQLQVCVQLIVSCPQNFILHPHQHRCVEIVYPKEPCKNGFKYNQFQKLCLDIDECINAAACKEKLEVCINTIGSFECTCRTGYKRNKIGDCEDINECNKFDICSAEQKCKNTDGSYKCVRAIPCGFGWKEDPDTNECVDVDECDSFPDICGPAMKCVNIRGSHKCEDEECPKDMKRNNRGICSRCKDGFAFNNHTQLCEDIDECSFDSMWNNGRCKDTEVCFNLEGSYECVPKKKCRQGTILTNYGTACEDIDECKQMKFRCESDQICVNTFSSYQCVASPCAPSQQYDYTLAKCVCRDGFQLNGEGICTDIDECSETSLGDLCGSMFICINHPGSYSCIHRAECPTGLFRSSMYSSCQDVDECETGEGKCPPNMHCVNMVGSYRCMCNRGYTMMQNNTCADVNECLLFRPEESCPDLEARCVNTAGSYKCQCPKGFQWSDYPIKKCTDINECQKSNPCGKEHECINIVGSYKCNCFKGYRLAISGDNCEDIDECLLEPRKCINGFCVNLNGRYSCRCPQGFTLDHKEICQDVDECASFEDVCRTDDQHQVSKMCINLLGYYKCINSSCPLDYEKRETGNGFMCVLKKENRCKLKESKCLFHKPYRKYYEFIEISSAFQGRRTISRLNLAHLPAGLNRMKLQLKYAHNTDTKESISMQNVFQLVADRYDRDNIELVMKKSIQAPAEILLYLKLNRFNRQSYFGHSDAFIHLYLTKYPSTSN